MVMWLFSFECEMFDAYFWYKVLQEQSHWQFNLSSAKILTPLELNLFLIPITCNLQVINPTLMLWHADKPSAVTLFLSQNTQVDDWTKKVGGSVTGVHNLYYFSITMITMRNFIPFHFYCICYTSMHAHYCNRSYHEIETFWRRCSNRCIIVWANSIMRSYG